MTASSLRFVAFAALVAAAPASAQAPTAEGRDWIAWLVIGAIALFVVGVVLRMIFSARFPQGYRHWARSRRESFEAHNEAWDRADEEFKR
jgi:hypothetical protein